jgi:organic radical activating enzyme
VTLTLATIAPGEPEIFASIQGEGPSMGKPCAFLRLSRCNLACSWCDTAYTWHFEGDERPHRGGVTYDRAENQVTMEDEEVAERIDMLGMQRLVITGGEPLLQAAPLARMLTLLPGVEVEIETNGTIAPPPVLDALIDQYNVSPKLAHSGNATELALVPERLEQWVAHPRAWFKFVIANPSDIEQVLAIKDAYVIPSDRIALMAEGTSASALKQREEWLVQACLTHNLTLSKRLHIELFGDSRGT